MARFEQRDVEHLLVKLHSLKDSGGRYDADAIAGTCAEFWATMSMRSSSENSSIFRETGRPLESLLEDAVSTLKSLPGDSAAPWMYASKLQRVLRGAMKSEMGARTALTRSDQPGKHAGITSLALPLNNDAAAGSRQSRPVSARVPSAPRWASGRSARPISARAYTGGRRIIHEQRQ